jgi:uncharacterized membrane protein
MNLVELPVDLQVLLKIGLESLVVLALTELAKYGFDFGGYKAQLTAALFSAAMVVVNYFLGLIPSGYEGVATAVLHLVVVLLGAFGLYKAYRSAFPKK